MFQKPVRTTHENTPICQFISKAVYSKLQPYLSQFNYSNQAEQRHNTTKSFYVHTGNIQVCRRMMSVPLPHWVADNHMPSHEPHGMSCTAVRAVTSGAHTQETPVFSHAPQKMLGSHTSPTRPSQPFLLWEGMQLRCIPLASSQCIYTASGPQHGPNTTRPMKWTSHSQRGSRWWIHHLEAGSCYYMWKHVTLYNQILLFTYFLYTCGKSKYEALLLY